MAISKRHSRSCNSQPADRCSARNRNRLLPNPRALVVGSSRSQLLLVTISLATLAMLASCSSALPIESTTLATEIEDVTAILPSNQEEISSTPLPTNQTETIVLHPVVPAKIEGTNLAQTSSSETLDGFVSVYGGTLEQDIKNDVNSEVEEAGSPAETQKETHLDTQLHEIDAAVQNTREPKTLVAEEEEKQSVEETDQEQDQSEPETVTDNIAVSSEQVESRSRPLPNVTSDLVSVILTEDLAITEQPITKTNLLALEQEHELLESLLVHTTPEPIYEEPKHQVTKKQGVVDVPPVVATDSEEEQLKAVEDPKVEEELKVVEEHKIEEERKTEEEPKIEEELKDVEEQKIEEEPKIEAEPKIEEELKVVEEQKIEEEPKIEEELVKAASEEGETHRQDRQLDQEDDKLNEIDENAIEGEEEPQKTSSTGATLVQVELSKLALEAQEAIEEKIEEEARAEIEAQVEGESPSEDTIVEPADSEDSQPDVVPKTTEEAIAEDEDSKDEVAVQTEQKEPVPSAEEETNPENSSTGEPEIQQIEVKEVAVGGNPNHETSSTVKQETTEGALQPDVESVEEKEERDESEAKATVQPEAEDNSSEEEKLTVGVETKSSPDDSTATPLVSYPPHDAEQTFDSNSADEHSAQLSGPSNYRSTLIIALCSGTAVIFIAASLVIFVVSFQRQHGTLDIEMQEQRLGKDVNDEEDAQLKLLDVDLTPPVIRPMGNEETDECL
ncbi:hypothetical protein KR009_002576 [Drosophila setifemur]|nr:hypothetical protein KR009_002576 [Drosophila setifemur]